MPVALVALAFLAVISGAGSALAQNNDQFNDAYYLTEGDGQLDLSQFENNPTNLNAGSSAGNNNSSNPPVNNTPSSNNPSTQSDVGSGGVVDPTSSVDSGASAGGVGGNTTGAPSAPTTEKEVLATLVNGGALIGLGGGNFDGGGGGVAIVLDGARMRKMLHDEPSIADILSHWRSVAGRKSRAAGNDHITTGEYYALIAATLAGDDERLDGATFSGTQFSLTYRSRGLLFAFIPLSFPVRVTIAATAGTPNERVQIHVPWYHWFMRTYFSQSALASDIDSIVTTELSVVDPEVEEDIQARIFVAIAQYLREKVQTISDSILLGASS